MQDKFEEFIKSSRQEFDVFEPRNEIWEKLENRLNEKKPVNNRKIYYVAASVVLFLICSFIAVQWSLNTKIDKQKKYSSIIPEQQEAEMYYASIIEIKRSELGQLKKEDPKLYKEFDKQIESMQTLYKQLKIEMDASPDKELVLQAMIENLQLQLQIVNQQLEIIREMKNFKRNDNEKVSI